MKMELSELKKLKKKYSEKISYISRNGTLKHGRNGTSILKNTGRNLQSLKN